MPRQQLGQTAGQLALLTDYHKSLSKGFKNRELEPLECEIYILNFVGRQDRGYQILQVKYVLKVISRLFSRTLHRCSNAVAMELNWGSEIGK